MRSDGRGLEKTKTEESYFVYSGGEEAPRKRSWGYDESKSD